MKLSLHFDLSEMTDSATAKAKGIENVPGPAELLCLGRLCRYVLETIRDHFGKPMTITSGFRCAELEKEISGVMDKDYSQHMQGLAADFVIAGVPCREIFKWIIDPKNGVPYDQCILEKNAAGSEWIHISYGIRRMALLGTPAGGGMAYSKVDPANFA